MGENKEIYRDVWFFHGALHFLFQRLSIALQRFLLHESFGSDVDPELANQVVFLNILSF